MIKINLLPDKKYKREKKKYEFEPKFILVVIVLLSAVVVMCIVFGYQNHKLKILKNDINQINQEIQRLQAKVSLVNQLLEKQKLISSRMRIIEQLNRDRFLRAQTLDEINRLLPPQMWLTCIAEKTPQLTIEGVTDSHFRISELLNRLGDSSYLKNVDLIFVQRTEIAGVPVVNFGIIAELVITNTGQTVSPSSSK